MPNRGISEVTQLLEQCLEADFQVETGKRWKFTTEFRAEVQDTFDDLVAANEDIPLSEGNRRTASDQLKLDYPIAEQTIRAVYNRIKGLSLTGSSLPLLVAYGFESGNLGRFDQSRVRQFLGQFLTTSADFADVNSPNHNAAAVLPPAWITEITNLKQRLSDNELLSSVGSRSDLVTLRKQKLLEAEDIISRIRHYLAYALPSAIKTRCCIIMASTRASNPNPTRPKPQQPRIRSKNQNGPSSHTRKGHFTSSCEQKNHALPCSF